MSKFNISPLILDINTVIRCNLEEYIKKYNSEYDLLETKHKEIMSLFAIINNTNKNENVYSSIVKTEKQNIDEEISKHITTPLVLEIEKIVKNGLSKILEEKQERYELLEKTQKSILELLLSPNGSVKEKQEPPAPPPKENITLEKIECKDTVVVEKNCNCCCKNK